MTHQSTTAAQLRSLVTPDGTVRLSLEAVDVAQPAEHEVLVRVDAAPINPSDIGLLFAGADIGAAEFAAEGGGPTVTAPLSDAALAAASGRVGQSLPAGNEGAGTVVAAGASPRAQGLLGRTVGVFGGAMYAEYRCVDAAQCLALPDGVSAAQGAACFVNPLTALGMVGTMQREGQHRAGAHRGGVEPRADAQPAVPHRRDRPRQRRAQAGAAGAAAVRRRHPRVRFHVRRTSRRS